MEKTERPWIAAERAITQELEDFQRRAADMWQGREKEAVIALVRVLDRFTITRMLDDASGRTVDPDRANDRFFVLMGAATALRPFLAAIKDQPGGVPWGPLNADVSEFAYSYLGCCGRLAHLRRMASLERYGLARTSWTSTGLTIQVQRSAPELALLESIKGWRKEGRDPLPGGESAERHWRRVRRKIRSYVDSVDGWFIRYDNDMKIVSAYSRAASDYGVPFLEREALPEGVQVGDRTFGEWRMTCDQALGRILCHIDFALQLKKKQPAIKLGNVCTIFARREDVAAVWMEAGLAPERVAPTMDALMY